MAKYLKWREREGLTLLEGWARDGLTDEQIAGKIGISRSTLAEWKSRYPDISDAMRCGKEVTDYQVEQALLKAAYGGNVQAMTFWLRNRKPAEWREGVLVRTPDGVKVLIDV